MKRLTVALVTGLMILSLTACGNKDTGVLIQAGDDNKNSSTEIVESTEQLDETTEQEDSSEEAEPVVNTENYSLMGVWSTEDGSMYTFDNGKFVEYNSQTNQTILGTYETDDKTFVDIKLPIIPETSAEEVEELFNTTKYSLEFSTTTNEYNQEFIQLVLQSTNEKIELTKNYDITEKTEDELEKEVENTITEQEQE